MRFDYPAESHIIQLRSLWKAAFGDTDEFLDIFFSTAYSPRRCRCAMDADRVAAVLYWFDISWNGLPCAYIYAVATDPRYRGQGLCRTLMADTAKVLSDRGYAGTLLVPQDEGLVTMYARMDYLPATEIREEIFAADSKLLDIRPLDAAAYAAERISLLPESSVIQEGENLTFLSQIALFYGGEDFLAAVSREPDHLRILEYLGDEKHLGSLIHTLGHREATARTPGAGKAFAMYLPLTPDCNRPEYFAFCFD